MAWFLFKHIDKFIFYFTFYKNTLRRLQVFLFLRFRNCFVNNYFNQWIVWNHAHPWPSNNIFLNESHKELNEKNHMKLWGEAHKKLITGLKFNYNLIFDFIFVSLHVANINIVML
jgi:hypothetical protein